MAAKTPNWGGRIARASVIAKLRRMKRHNTRFVGVIDVLDDLIEWVNMSASRYKKRPGGLK